MFIFSTAHLEKNKIILISSILKKAPCRFCGNIRFPRQYFSRNYLLYNILAHKKSDL